MLGWLIKNCPTVTSAVGCFLNYCSLQHPQQPPKSSQKQGCLLLPVCQNNWPVLPPEICEFMSHPRVYFELGMLLHKGEKGDLLLSIFGWMESCSSAMEVSFSQDNVQILLNHNSDSRRPHPEERALCPHTLSLCADSMALRVRDWSIYLIRLEEYKAQNSHPTLTALNRR